MSTIDKTLEERGSRYGEFPDHACLTQELKITMHDHERWPDLDHDMKECLDMIAHKIGRIINGDPNYIDSWTDIIGYTRLVEKRLIDEQRANKSMAEKIIGNMKVNSQVSSKVIDAINTLIKAGVIVETDDS